MSTARISAVIAALMLLAVAAADATPAKVKVMTRNLYLGADLTLRLPDLAAEAGQQGQEALPRRSHEARVRSGTFKTLLRVKPAGINVDVTRGWTSIDATVRGKKLHLVNTHLEG